ncbi:hypothetical protein TPHA_0D02090 [Tetrapisispora phaffii CBS 4417]|uniref:asparaginase n=1 Tax=Tetrapisispora phaffii (strain ATCC 24235 / CBS 4417 / NBRC 1672 / NRRL Y-8282 / UCD 70-5) TaxID=1071381 RepID=G8BSM6_TETPH|nr:hypothetical protein TPHA_0D02090 [Tetrapisispora phaffii CBS 4417]CCE62847.1 hypothetical protein TPHA_0D02090 [Tetrapisispora phaffii CBS 4417]
MPNNSVEITTICPDVENSKFIIQSLSSNGSKSNDNTKGLPADDIITPTLPRIKILGTGGTIAAKGSSGTQTAGYHVDLTIQELLDAIPDISNVCDIEYEQLCNVDSKDIDESILYKIYKAVSESLQGFDGIVIIHGTDTLSETAFFIESTIDTGDVPIVFVGSMRPSTSISADGPMNLYQAICIAASPKSRGRSVLVSLNDQISAGYYITKTNANSLDSFNVRQGYLGNFVNNEIHYYYPPVKPQGCHRFKLKIDLSQPNQTFSFPKVCILYSHQSFPTSLLDMVEKSYDGIIIATMGAGSLPDAANNKALKMNIPVIYSKRSRDGMIPISNLPKTADGTFGNIISSGYLNPEKSRILLQLCLFGNYTISEIRQVFGGVYGG